MYAAPTRGIEGGVVLVRVPLDLVTTAESSPWAGWQSRQPPQEPLGGWGQKVVAKWHRSGAEWSRSGPTGVPDWSEIAEKLYFQTGRARIQGIENG